MSNPTASPDSTPFADLLDDLYAECDELLASVRSDLLVLEDFVDKPAVDEALLDTLFRYFHTLKGLSGMVKMQQAEQLAHQMENYLKALKQGRCALSRTGISALMSGVKTLETVMAEYRDHTPLSDISAITTRLDGILAGDAASVAPAPPTDTPTRARTWRFEFAPSAELAARGIHVNSVRERLSALGKLIQARPCTAEGDRLAFEFMVAVSGDESVFQGWENDGITYTPVETEQKDPRSDAIASPTAQRDDTSASEEKASASLAASNVVRVDMGRLDDLMRIVGELVTSRSRQEAHIQALRSQLSGTEWRTLRETNFMIERNLRELREGIMQVRMVPINKAFERMRFVVHDLTEKTHKQVELTVRGEDTELDKLVVDRIMDPLLHLVRNAISHGIEPPEARTAGNKPAAGKLELSAYTAGDAVIIEVADDGAGIDVERVVAKARAQKLWTQGTEPDIAAVLEILCTPGFSMSAKVDRASGRGVGMDVVKNTVSELGGFFKFDTRPGAGTRFTVQLPLTLAIADALIITAGGRKFAVPLLSVREVFKIEPTQVIGLENHEVLSHHNTVVPLAYLSRLFRLPASTASQLYVLLTGSGLHSVGIVAEQILGEREIVVRALHDPLVQVPGIAGACELGDGNLALILDLGTLISEDDN